MATAVHKATGQRASPSVRRRHAGSCGRCTAFDAGVQQRGRGHALRLQPLRDDVLQLVEPLVQRLDAVQHMRVVRWRGLADTPSSGVRVVVADRSHSTSLPGPSSRRVT